MKNIKFKGFTLIECIIALAILGIASLVMAQIYATVSRMNVQTHLGNTSLAYQMKYAEDVSKTDTTSFVYNTALDAGHTGEPPHTHLTNNTTTSPYVLAVSSVDTEKSMYSCAADLYVQQSRYGAAAGETTTDLDKDGETSDENNYFNYKYLLVHGE